MSPDDVPAESALDQDTVDRMVEEILRGDDPYEVPAVLIEEAQTEITKGLAAQILEMKFGQKLKLALKGGREARTILIRDSNRLIQRFVLENPRITEDELIMVCKNRSADQELLTRIGKDREWSRLHQVRLALVTNPKTPVGLALRFLPMLGERDLRTLAKSKNVPAAVNGAAKRMVVERKKRE
jgi:hypothetical protein